MPALTFLEADRPLAKAYALDSNGNLTKESYPRVWEFTSHVVSVETMAGFAAVLRERAAQGWCLLKGVVARPLVCESRAGSTDPHTPTWYICLDFDQLPAGVSIDQALVLLGLADVTYVVQYSASYGIEPSKGATAHVFMQLSIPVSPPSLKQWLMKLNLATPALAAEIGLTKTNNALSWPLDISTCQNDKLIYIAPPLLGAGVIGVDGERIQLVAKARAVLDSATLDIPTVEANRVLMLAKLDLLRDARGLPPRKWAMKTDRETGLELLAKPDASTLTGLKRERGFTYFNLNGGDSWGYYHADDSPGVIRNFKGEPNYPTAELLPEYWGELQASRRQAVKDPGFTSTEPTVLVFRDFRTAVYYNGTWDPATQHLELARAASETQLRDFLKSHRLPTIDYVPIWNLTYDPTTEVRINLETRFLNTYEPSPYMTQQHAPVTDFERACPNLYHLVCHAVAFDPAVREHWLNWFACIFRLRTPTQVAWVLHGIPGTGKGMLFNRVMAPLMGERNVVIKRMSELDDPFNGYLAHAQLVVIDEADITENRNSRRVMADLKNMITEPQLSIRRMQVASMTVPNHCNFLFFTNQATPVALDPFDRRFNVGERRETRLLPTDTEVAAWAAELPTFANYLRTRTASAAIARSVLNNIDRAQLMATSTNSIDTTAQALLAGDLEFFWDALPAGEMGVLGVEAQSLHQAYSKLVHAALRAEKGLQRLTRDELRVLFAYNIGDVPRTPAKFTSLMRHHQVHLHPLRINGVVARGMEVTWKAPDTWRHEKLTELGQKTPAVRSIA